MTFNAEERSVLAALADVLIPAAADRLSAGQAEVAAGGLDQVLEARPDLRPGVAELIARARGRDPRACLAEIRAEAAELFGVLAEVVAGAYFMNPDVRQAIGYGGQSPRAIDPRPDYMEDGLLESVIRRGPIYRPTPAS